MYGLRVCVFKVVITISNVFSRNVIAVYIISIILGMCVLSDVQLFATPWASPPGSLVHEIFQARIIDPVAIPRSRGSSQHRDRT